MLNFDVVWEVFAGPLGPSWRSLGTLFGGLLGPLGASWGRLGELLGPSSGILGGILSDQAPKMPPRWPKELPRVPKTPQRPPKGPPRGLQEVFSSPQMASKNVSKGLPKKQRKEHPNHIIVIVNLCFHIFLSSMST